MFSTTIKATCIIFYGIEYVYSGCCCKGNQKNNSPQTSKGSKNSKGNNPPTTNTKTVIEEDKTNIITFNCPDGDEYITCNQLTKLNDNGEVAKTLMNEEYFDKDIYVYPLNLETFDNIINNKITFIYNNLQKIKNSPFIIFAVELCNGNHYLVCTLNTNYESKKTKVGFFRNISELKKVKILKNGKIPSCTYMFFQCKKLEYLDMSEFKTEENVSMSWMFAQCEALKYLDISHFKENMKINNLTFKSCNCLEEVRTNHNDVIEKLKSLGMKKVSNGLYKKQD